MLVIDAAVCTTRSVSCGLRGNCGKRLAGVRGSGCSTQVEYGFTDGTLRKGTDAAGATESLTNGTSAVFFETRLLVGRPAAALIANARGAALVAPKDGRARVAETINSFQ